MTAPELHLNAAPMALGALPADETAVFLEHLADCPVCSVEMPGFVETASRLGMAEARPAPASLRSTVLEAIRRTPQLPPLLRPNAEPLTARHRQDDAPGPVAAEPESTRSDDGVVVPMRRRWYARPQSWIAAGVAAVVIAFGAIVIINNTGSNGGTVASCATTQADRQTLAPQAGNTGDVVYSASCERAWVTPAGLAAPDPSKVYQLWVLDAKGNPRSVGVMTYANGSLQAKEAVIQPGDSATAISVETAPGPAAKPTEVVWVAKLA